MTKRLISIAASKAVVFTTSLIVIVALCVGVVWWLNQPTWPEFGKTQDNQPQVIVKVERDYAYHLGDLIEVEVFVHQPVGITIDPKSLSVGGDFELAQKPSVRQKELKDGSTAFRIGLAVQSFRVKKEQVMEGTLSYRADDKRQDLTIKPLTIHTSNTWDGRKELMEGADPRVPMLWYTLRHAVPLAVSSIIFLVLTVVAFRNWLKTRVKEPAVDQVLVRVTEIAALIRSGECTKAQYLELDGLIRAEYAIGPIPCNQLSDKQHAPIAIKLLQANEPAIYAEEPLPDDQRATLSSLLEEVLERWR